MIRIHVFTSFLATGVCAALLAPGWTSGTETGWDSRESKSELFDQQTNPFAKRATHASTRPTLSNWERPRITRAVVKTPSATGEPRGARLSLVSFRNTSSTLTPCDDGPDNQQPPVWFSITTPNGQNTACSTAASNYASADNCSVNAAPSSFQPSCSTMAASGGFKGWLYCSTNVGNGAGPATCSASGNATGAGQNSCSAGSGATAICSTQGNSTQGNNGNTSNQCSAGVMAGASTQSQCSAGGLSGTAGGAGTCSTQCTGNVNGNQNNTCSVASSGTGNQCSTDGSANSKCSTFGGDVGGQTDACSVAQGLAHAVCTAFNPNSGQAVCSANAGAKGNCSVITGNGTANPPVGGLCGTP